MSDHPLIYVDLIEEEPDPFEVFAAGLPESYDGDLDATQDSYRAYRVAFQPWRILVKSGDNHEPLFRSTERYLHEADAHHAAEIAFGSRSNVYLRQKEHGNVPLRMARDA